MKYKVIKLYKDLVRHKIQGMQKPQVGDIVEKAPDIWNIEQEIWCYNGDSYGAWFDLEMLEIYNK